MVPLHLITLKILSLILLVPDVLPVSVMSQSVSSSRASGWTAEQSLMKMCPLDLTALKKVNQRLGSSSFPLQAQRKTITLTYTRVKNTW